MNTQENIETYDDDVLALAEYLECEPDDLSAESYDHYDMHVYSYGGAEYAIGTDDQANDAATAYIKDSVWAFNASFLSSETGLPEEMFAFASEQCESANDAILQVIEQSCGLDSFVETAISYDGRGHFISGYNGNEGEQGEYFIYRTN